MDRVMLIFIGRHEVAQGFQIHFLASVDRSPAENTVQDPLSLSSSYPLCVMTLRMKTF
jgi:hypothetical protein